MCSLADMLSLFTSDRASFHGWPFTRLDHGRELARRAPTPHSLPHQRHHHTRRYLPAPLLMLDLQIFASSSVSTAVTAVGVRKVCRSGCVLFSMLLKSVRRSLSRCSSCCLEASKRSLSFRIILPCLLTSCWSSSFGTTGTAQFFIVAVPISSDLRTARPTLIGTSAHFIGQTTATGRGMIRVQSSEFIFLHDHSQGPSAGGAAAGIVHETTQNPDASSLV